MIRDRAGLFSVSYAGLWGQASLSACDFVRKAAALGYGSILLMAKKPHLDVARGASIAGGMPRSGMAGTDASRGTSSSLGTDRHGGPTGPHDLVELRRVLDETGVRLIGLACYTDALMAGAAEVPVRDMQLCYLESCFRVAEYLGGAIVRVFTGYVPDGMSYFKAWSECSGFLREAGNLAAERGLTLAVQNHHDLAVDTDSMERLLDEVGLDSVKAGFDAWSPHLRGEDLHACALRMASRTALSIAADYRRVPRWKYEPSLVNYRKSEPEAVAAVAMGSGEVDYASFYRGLADGGYSGPIVYEMCSPLSGGPGEANLDAKARGFLSHLDSVWPEGRG